MDKNKRRDTILSIIIVLVIILMVIGVTYAFFAGVLTNNSTPITVNSDTVSLTYTDCGSNNGSGSANNHCQLISASLKPGESVEKTFKVQNMSSSGSANFTLLFRRLLNTFTNNELVYKIEDVTNPNNITTVVAANTPVPYRATEDNNVIINTNNSIAYNTTREFKMTITFVNQPDIDQSYNASAQFLIQVGISEYVPPFVAILKSKANPASNTNYSTSTTAQKAEMYTFSHAAAAQTPAQTDYRYIGSTPNNYVKFNCTNPSDTTTCETWRILGVFPVDDGTGNYTERVKLIRNDSIGNIAWDTKASRGATDTNEWVGSNLAKILNTGDYYTRNGSYASKGLTTSAKSMIDTAQWYLGAVNSASNKSIYTIYSEERGTTLPNLATWQEINTNIYNVGIMYPSDYIFTYANGVNDKCFNDSYNCNNGTPNASWLYKGESGWLISPGHADESSIAWFIDSNGKLYDGYIDGVGGMYFVNNTRSIRPVVYLKSNIEIDATATSADGSANHPYILKAN